MGVSRGENEKKNKIKHQTEQRRDRTYRVKVLQTEESTFGFVGRVAGQTHKDG